MTAELVKIIGGDISVVSELHVGSTFTVSLPLGARHVPKNQLLDQQTEQEFNSMPSRLECEANLVHPMPTSQLIKVLCFFFRCFIVSDTFFSTAKRLRG